MDGVLGFPLTCSGELLYAVENSDDREQELMVQERGILWQNGQTEADDGLGN